MAAALAATKRRQFLLGTAVGLVAPYLLWATGASDALWAAFTGWPVVLLLVATGVFFSAIHDRCPIWQGLKARLGLAV